MMIRSVVLSMSPPVAASSASTRRNGAPFRAGCERESAMAQPRVETVRKLPHRNNIFSLMLRLRRDQGDSQWTAPALAALRTIDCVGFNSSRASALASSLHCARYVSLWDLISSTC